MHFLCGRLSGPVFPCLKVCSVPLRLGVEESARSLRQKGPSKGDGSSVQSPRSEDHVSAHPFSRRDLLRGGRDLATLLSLSTLAGVESPLVAPAEAAQDARRGAQEDRKSTRLNSSHSQISYAVFCLKKKKKKKSKH